jgi:hypothetical protein
MKRLFYLIVLTAATTPLWAGEFVVLGTGFRLHADRHELAGDVVRIYSGTGMVEMPTGLITSYEPEEITKPSPVDVPAPTAVAPAAMSVLPKTPRELAGQAAAKYKLPGSFVASVMKAESGFQPKALSPKGAIGLMQLMPETARTLGVNPHDPNQNADGGAAYLRDLLARYENDPNQVLLALAAYNAGPAAVERYHGVPPYAETREYILRVLKNWDQTGNK